MIFIGIDAGKFGAVAWLDGARHLRRWLDTCGDIRAALGVFNGWKKCSLGRRSPYARDVLRLVREAEGAPRT